MKPVLTVYSYSSFVGKYGPGKAVKERFEATCGCEVAYVAADDLEIGRGHKIPLWLFGFLY